MSQPTAVTPSPEKMEDKLEKLWTDLQALHMALPDSLSPPRWASQRLCGLSVQTEQVPSTALLRERLLAWCDHPAVQGWIETSHAVQEVTPGAPLSALKGTVLSADLARPDAALRVRTAASGWSLTVLAETEPGAPGTEPVLVRGIVQAGIRGKDDTLRYRLAQTLIDGTLRPVDAWFIGFGA